MKLEVSPLALRFNFSRFLKFFLSYSLITSLVFSISINSFQEPVNSLNAYLPIAIINLLLPIVMVSYSLSFGQAQLVAALFWTFQYLFFGLTGFLVCLDPAPYYLAGIVGSQFKNQALEISLLASFIVAFFQLIASKYNSIKSTIIATPSISLFSQTLNRRIRYLLLVYLLILPFVLQKLGGFGYLFRKVRYGYALTDISLASNAIYESTLLIPPLITLLILIFLRKNFTTDSWIEKALLLWVIFLSNPLANARQTTLLLLFPLFFVYMKKNSKLIFPFFLLLPVLTLTIANLVDRFSGKISYQAFISPSRSGDFDAFSQLANGAYGVSMGGFPIFKQIQGPILFFVPRTIWPGKPYDTGVELAQMLGLKFQNLSAPWLLEAIVNARTLGAIVISALIGWSLTRIDLRSNADLRSWLICGFLFGILYIVLRGSLLQATGKLVFGYGMIFFLTRGMKMPKHSDT